MGLPRLQRVKAKKAKSLETCIFYALGCALARRIDVLRSEWKQAFVHWMMGFMILGNNTLWKIVYYQFGVHLLTVSHLVYYMLRT